MTSTLSLQFYLNTYRPISIDNHCTDERIVLVMIARRSTPKYRGGFRGRMGRVPPYFGPNLDVLYSPERGGGRGGLDNRVTPPPLKIP